MGPVSRARRSYSSGRLITRMLPGPRPAEQSSQMTSGKLHSSTWPAQITTVSLLCSLS